jgi:putative inorganic carbon (hco3(-)) transporter
MVPKLNKPKRGNRSFRLGKFVQTTFLEKKLDNWFGYLLIILLAVILGYVNTLHPLVGIGLIGGVIGLVIVGLCLFNAEAGMYINFFYSFSIFHISRLFFNDNFPVGMVSDLLVLTTFFGLFLQRTNVKDSLNRLTRSTVGICILIYFFYLLIELFNPDSKSFEGWFMAFRKVFSSVALLFVAYTVLNTYQRITRYLKVVFIGCTIAGIYGCIQQWHGLFDFERAWAFASEKRFVLTYIGDNFRKFSTFSDCSAFGVVMAAGSAFFIIIGLNREKRSEKLVLFGGSLFMLLSMVYSGTRTANAMLVAGVFMYILLTFEKKSTRIFAFFAVSGLLFILYAPFYSNQQINRFRTTFSSSKDESYKVRIVNRAFVQPYIHSHPIGGGLGTTDAAGLRYQPGHYLAGFPTDSGYLKKALETGWVGLGILCILYFVVLKEGVRGYFACKDEKLKVLYAACTVFMFCFYVGEYPQNAIGQITDVVIYYPLIAVILKLKELDNVPEV